MKPDRHGNRKQNKERIHLDELACLSLAGRLERKIDSGSGVDRSSASSPERSDSRGIVSHKNSRGDIVEPYLLCVDEIDWENIPDDSVVAKACDQVTLRFSEASQDIVLPVAKPPEWFLCNLMVYFS